MGVTEQIAVLNFGKQIAFGTPGEVQRNEAVQEALPRHLRLRLRRGRLRRLSACSAFGTSSAPTASSTSCAASASMRPRAGSPAFSVPTARGKTTTLFTIAGILSARSGSVLLNGEDLTRLPAPRVVSRGIALVPENRLVSFRA